MSAPEELDINQWLPIFPLEEYDPYVASNDGPSTICHIEQIRERALACFDLGRSLQTDIFIFGLGEPDRRDITKVGGLPYRPRGKPWPMSRETGKPLTFVAQFRFTESTDIVGPLPGDILLAYFEDWVPHAYHRFAGPPVFEWYSLGLEHLIEADEIPEGTWADRLPICYGVRHRTVDYIEEKAVDLLQSMVPENFDEDDDEEDDEDDEDFDEVLDDTMQIENLYSLRHWLCTLSFLKIGGTPAWRFPEVIEEDGIAPGRFLASIPRIYGGSNFEETHWPYVNVEYQDYEASCKVGSLMWISDGIVHLFLDENGEVQPRFDKGGVLDPPSPYA